MLFWHTYKFNNGRYYRFLQTDLRLNFHPDVQKMYKSGENNYKIEYTFYKFTNSVPEKVMSPVN